MCSKAGRQVFFFLPFILSFFVHGLFVSRFDSSFLMSISFLLSLLALVL